MLKKLAVVGLVVLLAGWSYAGDWFDMTGCGICKCMGDNMSIMHEITWETHKLPNGVLSVSIIPDKHKQTMKDVHEEMMAAVKRLEEGEEMGAVRPLPIVRRAAGDGGPDAGDRERRRRDLADDLR